MNSRWFKVEVTVTLYIATQSHELRWKLDLTVNLTVASETLVHSFSYSNVTRGRSTLNGNWGRKYDSETDTETDGKEDHF
jgi:hypothetical protein